ncbi:MAG TPA: LPS assembly protein LptD [Novosphingobium sp.]|nr:LPS assembly protein LptD [Novosphingobium sp.]HZV09972.1 LPS assembly protein LptD [Novosphingobium sp.]
MPAPVPAVPIRLLGASALALVASALPVAARAMGANPATGSNVSGLTSAGPSPTDERAPDLPPLGAKAAPASSDPPIYFEANRVDYDHNTDIAVATGDVFLRRNEQTVRADKVTWNRKTGKIHASGHIHAVDRNGNELLTEEMDLTDDLNQGATDAMLLLLREGGRLAASQGVRQADGTILMTHTNYTGCDVVDSKGCPKTPSWQVTAGHVLYDPNRKLLRFKGARLAFFGVRLVPVPGLEIATDGRAMAGFMVPNLHSTSTNGFEYDQTFYAHIGTNRDIAITGSVFTKVQPMAGIHYRALTDTGAYQITGYITKSPVIPQGGTDAQARDMMRGYIDINGRFQLDPNWSVSFSGRAVTDRTFLTRYNITGEDMLRSTVDVERIDANSYFSIAGWNFETLRTGDTQGTQPIALPEIDYRRRLAAKVLGGTVDLQANSLALTRSAGQDTQRAFVSAQWSLRKLTDWGQQITFTALARGDLYHSTGNYLTTTAVYQGAPGWQSRGVVLGAVDVAWPLVGQAFGGTQVLTPRVQLVAAPNTPNLRLPNEDSRAIELEDVNLFALNRYSGYDRIEDGTRITYGLDWHLERPRWRIIANVGQSYRFKDETNLLPDGTGLGGRLSDIVGRTEIRYRDFFAITHRYRLDKDTMAFRRNEVDATIGSDQDYLEVGYVRLNRQLAGELEDLQDSNEARVATRVAFARYWSMFGSAVVDMSETNASGQKVGAFQPLRTRLGFSYQSDCFEFDADWRRDYVTIGDAYRGSSFELRFVLKNLGFH